MNCIGILIVENKKSLGKICKDIGLCKLVAELAKNHLLLLCMSLDTFCGT